MRKLLERFKADLSRFYVLNLGIGLPMLTVISPAKSLDFESTPPAHTPSEPQFLAKSEALIKVARKWRVDDVQSLMGISEKLALLNVERFKAYKTPFTPQNARAAMFAFDGDVYTGLDAYTLKKSDIEFAQKHLRILSGLYGLLRPLDLMQAYRLEMGLPVAVGKTKNLHGFWIDTVTQALSTELSAHKSPILINLASTEYFGAVKAKSLSGGVITPVFKELRGNKAQIISFFAKQARGQMARYMITQRIDRADGLKDFDVDGYRFDASLSKTDQFVFTRKS
jgi:uncharacterized protein